MLMKNVSSSVGYFPVICIIFDMYIAAAQKTK